MRCVRSMRRGRLFKERGLAAISIADITQRPTPYPTRSPIISHQEGAVRRAACRDVLYVARAASSTPENKLSPATMPAHGRQA